MNKRLKVLVAEDDMTSRTLLQHFFSTRGECHTATDGQEAVDAACQARDRRESFDLICMDLRMPNMEGQEAIRRIRKHEAASSALHPTKILVTTAHTDMESITSALLARCNAYLVKPIALEDLLNELRTLGLLD